MIIYGATYRNGYRKGYDDGQEKICKELKHHPYTINNKFHCRKDKL